jgi:signal transduction histidine kinase
MTRSIRNQILVPLIGIQAIAVTAVALATASLAARRAELEITARLNGVIATLEHGGIPLTAATLAKMSGLSGAHFLVVAPDGKVTETSLLTATIIPHPLPPGRPRSNPDSLDSAGTLNIAATTYFALPVHRVAHLANATLWVLYPETSLRQVRYEAALPPLILGIASLAAMVLVTSLIAHRITTRIQDLERQVARIAAGEFQPLDPTADQDEVGDLTRSISRMSLQLRDMRRKIEQSERARLLAQFAAGLAHQLRNALTGARMSVQLHARRFPPPPGDETLSVALRQLAITEEQVKGLLSIGRVKRLELAPCDLRQIVAEVDALVTPACRHANVLLEPPTPGDPIELTADRAGLGAAILNLTLNAIEAAGPGGQVSLSIDPSESEVTIHILDNGPGPPDHVADTLFEPFVTTKAEGSGLGLAIAHQVATDHGGRLSWTRINSHTRFTLVIPATRSLTEVLA